MKKLNINKLIWLLILLCYTFYFAVLHYTGRINLFIHPKMQKYSTAALIAFIILSCFQLLTIFEEDEEADIKLGYFILIIPIVIGISYKPKALSGKWVEVRGLNILQAGNINHEHGDKISMETAIYNDNIIYLNDKNYVDVLNIIYNSRERVKGKKLVFEGFIYKQKNINKDQFITARMIINCCAADTQITGFLCKYDKTNLLKENQWVRIIGTIDTTAYMDENNNKEGIVPQILVESLEELPEPINKYIYH